MILDILSMVAYGVFILLGLRLIIMVGAITRLLIGMSDVHELIKNVKKDSSTLSETENWLRKNGIRS